jgi:hypothetical protein
MMTGKELMEYATVREHFRTLQNYVDFARAYIEFAEQGLQARIVCQNETNYRFFQYREDCSYNISRPINADLFFGVEDADAAFRVFLESFQRIKSAEKPTKGERQAFVRAVYTMQQSIGAALDALPASRVNQAKKMNGDLFEHLVRLLFQESGVDCRADSIAGPVPDEDGGELFRMNYQHDIVVRGADGDIQLLGSVKTSSKDRIDKIFVDKMLFSRLTGRDTPYISVFLNDVQRAKTAAPGRYQVNSTFLTGHFKAYTIRLAPLDGVFYCDLRPNMRTDPFLAARIRPLDGLFFDELRKRGLVKPARRRGASVKK